MMAAIGLAGNKYIQRNDACVPAWSTLNHEFLPECRTRLKSFRTDDEKSFCGQCRSRSDCTEHAV